MTTTPKRDPIEYLLNSMEAAGQKENPAEWHYGDKRRAVLDAVAEVRADVERLEALLARVEEAITKHWPRLKADLRAALGEGGQG